MRFTRSLLASGVAAAMAVALAGPAMAAPAAQDAVTHKRKPAPLSVVVSPPLAKPGTVVEIRTMCPGARSGRAWSLAFGAITLRPASVKPWLFGAAKVRSVRSGTYRVHVSCSTGRHGTGRLTVFRHRIPRGFARTGGGSTGAASAVPRTAPLSAGVALLLVGSGLRLAAVRRRRQTAGR